MLELETKNTSAQNLSDVLMGSEQFPTDLFFRILVFGNFLPNQIKTIYNDDQKIEYPPSVKTQIEEEWLRVLVRNSKALPGPLIRLNAFGVDNNRLFLELGRTDYKQYRGTVALSEEERRENRYELANPLAGSIIIFSQDACGGQGGLLLSQRSQELVHHPGGLEFPGGNVDYEDLDEKGHISPIITALRELEEEQGVRGNDLENIRLLGIVYEMYQDAAPTAIMTADLKKSVNLEELTNRQRDSESIPVWMPADPDNLIKTILDYSTMCCPFVLGGFYLFLKSSQHTSDKAEYFLSRLQRRGNVYGGLSVDQLTKLEERKQHRWAKKLV